MLNILLIVLLKYDSCKINDSTMEMINCNVYIYCSHVEKHSFLYTLFWRNPLSILYPGVNSSFDRNERSTGCENPSSCHITWRLRTGLKQAKGRAGRTLSSYSENVMNRAIKTWNSQLQTSASWYLPTSGCFRNREGETVEYASVTPFCVKR